MTNLVRAARNILLAVGELPPNKKLIHAAFALQEALAEQAEQEHDGHWSDCSVHNEPAYPNGPCDCGGYPPKHWRCACGANLYIDSNGAPASKAEQAEQKPVAVVEITYGREPECYVTGNIDDFPEGVFKLYAAPVRTKDLTDEEISKLRHKIDWTAEWSYVNFARSVIAADREKNK